MHAGRLTGLWQETHAHCWLLVESLRLEETSEEEEEEEEEEETDVL